MLDSIEIRQATSEDAATIMGLVKELATFEKMADQVRLSEEQMAKDLARDAVRVKLAFVGGAVAGMTLYFYVYSSWDGQCVHMEDLYVKSEWRRQGVARALVRELAKEADQKSMARINWTVLDWNHGARDFYHKLNAVDLSSKHGWICYRLKQDAIKALANEQ